jgi:hypothetical protein
MEMSKDFETVCPGVRVTINQQVADYTVLLNHIEVGLFVRDNQFQIANKDGDLISKTKEGGSILNGVKKACDVILADWSKSQSTQLQPERSTRLQPPEGLSPRMDADFTLYSQYPGHKAFAVSSDGQHYAYSHSKGDQEAAIEKALDTCRYYAKKTSCEIIASE